MSRAAEHTNSQAAYTESSASTRASPLFGFVYWPCLGVWPLVVGALVAMALGYWARRETPFPSSVVCTSAFHLAGPDTGSVYLPGREGKRVDATCSALDSRAIRTWMPIPCTALSAALAGLLDARNLLHSGVLYATETTAAASPVMAPFRASGDDAGGIDQATARALLLECAGAPGTEPMPRTVQVVIFRRDYELGAVVAVILFGAILVAGFRRRVRLDVDPAGRLLLVVERGFVFEHRTVAIPIDDIRDVTVSAGAFGFLSGRQVALVRVDGGRVPLTESYIPLTYRAHHQAARRLLAYVSALRARAT